MVNWKEVYSKPCLELFAKLVNSWEPLIFFTKSSVLDFLKDSEYASAAIKNLQFLLYIAIWNNIFFAIPVQLNSNSKCLTS